MKLISEEAIEVNFVTEEDDNKKKNYFIEGIFMQSETKNRNGRVYPKVILQKEVKRYTEKFINTKRAFGELGHPDGPTVNLERVSHMITELVEDGDNFLGRAKIMDTPYGKIVKNLIDEGAKLGVSSRGMGSLKPVQDGLQEVQSDFYLATAADIVADPSAPDAFVSGIMEGKEWVWDNGLIKEKEIVEYQKRVERATEISRNKVRIEAFENFITKL
ncbi:primosomal protein [Marine Group I thaumarchaeote]|jgi:hypothetical protein|uniref:Primosomal protein n=1 Tax=Marine Group I thaumarchaeote TaxID=2511932 RepID=A0A7K4MQU9_9ARCH|nr:primosomal protein [Marine Group I thaumarchaeote]|tara:strand:+ start:1012 stop:1662 length:651 start_codon:yes stop_codon:yes gene_type:complete